MIPRRKPYFSNRSLFKIIRGLTMKVDGSEIEKLELDLKKILNLPNPVVVGQGRIGLTLILKESGIRKGSEVIMPAYTFGTLTYVIKKAGFKPVPVDIDPETYEMSANKVAQAITKNTGAILATHLFGEPCDIWEIQKIAKKNNIYLIEDCAQSLAATSNGKMLGTFGDASFSSFDISKPLQGIRGGVVFSKNKALIKKIRTSIKKNNIDSKEPLKEALRGLWGLVITQTPIWYVAAYFFGFQKFQKIFVKVYRAQETKEVSYKLPPVFAKVVRGNLKNFRKRLVTRRNLRDLYKKHLGKLLSFQKIDKKNKGSVYILAAKVNANIFELRRYLALRGVDIALANEVADNCLKSKGSNVSDVYKNTIALPIYESLTKKQIVFISNLFQNFLTNKTHQPNRLKTQHLEE